MATERRLYVGPSLRRLRRDQGLTQADMAADLEVSASYVALLERNHRPLSAEMLLRLAQTYKLDMAALAADTGSTDIASPCALPPGSRQQRPCCPTPRPPWPKPSAA
mgnify:CR=1 FL=1